MSSGDLEYVAELRRARRQDVPERPATFRRGVVTGASQVDGAPAERACADSLAVGDVVILMVKDGGRTVIGKVRDW
jgi:hypothetical protein